MPSRYGGFYDPSPGAYGPDDPGGTDYNPQSGLRDRYAVVPPEPAQQVRPVTMLDVLEQWTAVELDLHEVFGIDVEDDAVMVSRSWRWLELRLRDLVDRGPRLGLALRAG